MQGSRFGQQQLGKLTPRLVHYLRQTNYDLFARATHGSPAELRAYAGRLRAARDEARFRVPAFGNLLEDLIAIAEASALEREQRRRKPLVYTAGSRLTWRTNGLAKFSRRFA